MTASVLFFIRLTVCFAEYALAGAPYFERTSEENDLLFPRPTLEIYTTPWGTLEVHLLSDWMTPAPSHRRAVAS